MRIGLVIYGGLEQTSGGYLYDRELIRALERHGDRVSLICLPRRGFMRALADNYSASLGRRLAALPLDILLEDELAHPSLFRLNRWLKNRVVYPIISIVHHLRSDELHSIRLTRLCHAVESNYLSGVDGFVYCSEATRRAVESFAAGRPGIVAHPGGDRLGCCADEQEIRDRCGAPGPLKIIYLGNIIPRKGLRTLLAALGSLPRASYLLNVIGDTGADRSYPAEMVRLAKSLGLGAQVKFAGRLPDRALAEELKSGHALAVPSSWEGFGIAYLEGMGLGLPAIGGRAGGTSEVITHGRDGFLVAPGDVAGLAHCLNMLGEDRKLLLSMSLAARRTYARHPPWQTTTERVRAFLLGMTRECSR